jgi:imidazolonepropionase-like amidohydrolase
MRFEGRIKLTGAMFRAGVGVLAGTDAHGPFNVPGFSLHDELELFARGGLTPHEALDVVSNKVVHCATLEKRERGG